MTSVLRLLRLLTLLGLGLAAAPGILLAAPPTLALAADAPRLDLVPRMDTVRLPLGQPQEAALLWSLPDGGVDAGLQRWAVRSSDRMLGRITLDIRDASRPFLLQVPPAWIDEVRIWHRGADGQWRSARAGDRFALSTWPFISPTPAFVLPSGEGPLDLMVLVTNAAPASVPVWLMPDPLFRETQLRQSNLSGIVTGLGLMVSIVTLMGAFVLRQRAQWLLAGASFWLLLVITSLNGYLAVWLTPDLPGFNDAIKHVSGVVMAALVFALTADALDPRYLSRPERLLKILVPVAGVTYAVLQIVWLPDRWRPIGAFLWTGLALLGCLVMCVRSAVRGGRYVRWISAAVAAYGAALLLAYAPLGHVGWLDLRAAVVGSLFFASMLLFHQALFARARYGRDVLGRAAIAASRDPLTALLSYQGFREAYDRALLRQRADAEPTPFMLLELPGLPQGEQAHGFVLSDRVVVRFAAILQAVLGDAWAIGRLDATRFACIGTGAAHPVDVQTLATHVLSRCARLGTEPQPLAELDLRIACTERMLRADGLKPLLAELDEAARTLAPRKRIVRI